MLFRSNSVHDQGDTLCTQREKEDLSHTRHTGKIRGLLNFVFLSHTRRFEAELEGVGKHRRVGAGHGIRHYSSEALKSLILLLFLFI